MDIEYIKSRIIYDPDDGKFTWVDSNLNRANKRGVEAGTKRYRYKNSVRDKPKCVHIKIDGDVYMAHHLAFLFMTGELPKGVVDHIDGNPFNNKWHNLRDVTVYCNNRNRVFNKRFDGDIAGVRFDKQSEKWKVSISVNSKYIHLGYFENHDEAVRVRREAEKEYGYHPNHG